MRVPCGELDVAFDAWRLAPAALVGFLPRVHVRSARSSNAGSGHGLVYRCWWRVW